MSADQQTGETGRHTGKKIWYGIVIALSAIVIVMSIAGILGTWATGRALSDFTVEVLAAVEKAASRGQILVGNVERGLEDIQDLTTQVSEATEQIGQNVTDRGLVRTLLPEDRESRLVERAQTVVDTLAGIRAAVNSTFEVYQAVDRLPFISLPKPATETVDKLEQASNDLQAMVNDLAQAIHDFHAGVAGSINRITSLSDRIGSRLDQARQNLTAIQKDLAMLQQQAAELQTKVPLFFNIASLVVSLFFVFLLYTQVEVIRLFVGRWRGLNQPAAALPEVATTEALPPEAGSTAAD